MIELFEGGIGIAILIGLWVIAILTAAIIVYLQKIYKIKRNRRKQEEGIRKQTEDNKTETTQTEVENPPKQNIFKRLKVNRARKKQIGKFDTWK